MNVDTHRNVEQVIRYYLSFLPPRGVRSILDIGAGESAPYSGMLKTRCKEYKSLDIRPGPKVDFVCDVTQGTKFRDHKWEWGWCIETMEHIPYRLQNAFVIEIMRICQCCVFTFPTSKHKSFYGDPGHHVVRVNFPLLFKRTHRVINKSTNSGRAIWILATKSKPISLSQKGIKYEDL